MNHDNSVEYLPPIRISIGLRLFHFLFLKKHICENPEYIFWLFDCFIEVFGQRLSLILVHEGDLWAVFDSFLVESEKDWRYANEADKKPKDYQHSKLFKLDHNVDIEHACSEYDQKQVNRKQPIKQINFLNQGIVVVMEYDHDL